MTTLTLDPHELRRGDRVLTVERLGTRIRVTVLRAAS